MTGAHFAMLETKTATGSAVATLRYILLLFLLVGVYHAASRLGLFLQVSYGGLTPIWPASGIAVVLLWRGGGRWWPVILTGEFLNALYLGQAWPAGLNGGLAQLLEAGLAGWLLRRLAVSPGLDDTRSVFRFVGAACLAPPLLAASLGAGGLWWLGELPAGQLPRAWFTWWLGDAMGILLLAPALVLWRRWPWRSRARTLLWAGLTLLLVACSLLLMWQAQGEAEQLFFLLLPLVVLSAAYTGAAGAASAALLMAALVLGLNLQHVQSDFTAALRIAFVGASAFTGLLVAAALAERRRLDRLLSREQLRARITLESIGDGVLCTDESGLVSFLNTAAERLTGWTLEDAAGRPVEEVLPIEDTQRGPGTVHPVRRCLSSGIVQNLGRHSRVQNRAGRPLAIEDSVAPIHGRDGGVEGAVVAFRDVTVERELRKRLEYQATHDVVTGLANRFAFDERLRELAGGEHRGPVHALIYLDLDQFKLVNDSCGHEAGDRLLAELSSVLSGISEPHLVARLGGDEFAVLLPSLGEHAALEMAEDLRRAVLDFRFHHGELLFTLGASLGVTHFRGGEESPDEIMSRADIACYMAKDAGRNRIHVYHAGDTETLMRHAAIHRLAQLQSAMDAGRFRLHCQRIFRVDGEYEDMPFYELLLRLHEGQELVGPEHFLPVAERFGLMPFIDRWVVEQAFRALAEHARRPLRLSINLTGTTLDDVQFHDFIMEMQRRYAVDPRRICFEVTESLAIRRLTRAVDYMRRLAAEGYQFALDDFGAGVASFAYLQELPVDIVKLDGRIVQGLTRNPANEVIIDALVRLAHYRGIVCVAEWVEDAESLELLRRLGVEMAQGHHLDRPRPLADILDTEEEQTS